MRELKVSTATDRMVFMTQTDGKTGATGLTLTVTASKAGGAFGSITPTVTERGSGWYSLALTSSHTDTLGDLALHVTASGADPSDLLFGVVANLEADTFARLGSPAGASVSADVAAVKTQTTAIETDTQDIQSRLPAALTGAGNIKADALSVGGSAVAAGSIPNAAAGTSAGLALNSDVTSVGSAVASNGTAVANLAADVADLTALVSLYAGTVANADASAIDLGALGLGDDELNGLLIRVYDDSADEYHVRWVTDFDGTTSVATLSSALPFTTESGVDTFDVYPVRRDVDAAALSGTVAADVADAVWDEAQGGHTTAGTFGRYLDAQVANVEADTQNIQTRIPAALVSGRIDASVGAMAANTLTASAIAADAIGASELAADAAAEVAAAVWNATAASFVASGSFGQRLYGIRSGTAQGGASTTITLDAGASAVDDFYNNGIVAITAGTGAGQSRIISDYVGSTKVASVPAWATAPSSDSVFVILPFGAIPGATAPTASEVADAVWDEPTSGHTASGSFGEQCKTDIDAILADTGTDGVVVASVGTGAITSASFAANSITAAAAATDFGAEIADAVWDEARSGHTTVGTFGQGVASVQGNVTGSVNSVTGSVGSVTGNVGGNVSGNLVGSVGSLATQAKADVNAEVDIGLADVGVTTTVTGRIDAAVSTRATPAQVNAEVLDVMTIDTFAEPGQGSPPASATVIAKVGYLYKAWRNRHAQTATEYRLYNDDAVTVDQKATVSDDGSTTSVGEVTTGP